MGLGQASSSTSGLLLPLQPGGSRGTAGIAGHWRCRRKSILWADKSPSKWGWAEGADFLLPTRGTFSGGGDRASSSDEPLVCSREMHPSPQRGEPPLRRASPAWASPSSRLFSSPSGTGSDSPLGPSARPYRLGAAALEVSGTGCTEGEGHQRRAHMRTGARSVPQPPLGTRDCV